MSARLLVVAALAFVAVFSWDGRDVAAHKTVVSQFTFYKDVQPILQRRCGACHTAGGIAPTSLQTFHDAQGQSWPIRQALIAGRMPPSSAESGDIPLKQHGALTARELDTLMTWASGGTPEGTATDAAAPVAAAPSAPDVVLPMPAAFLLAAGVQQMDHEIVLRSNELRGEWIRAVEVLPEARAIVRRAQIAIRSRAGDQVIGLWTPGDTPQVLEGGGAFPVPPDGSLVLRLHYQRPNAGDGAAIRDRSQVGVYLAAPATGRPVRTVELGAAGLTIARAMRAVAFRPVAGPPGARVELVAVASNGVRTRLLGFQLHSQWPRRYIFSRPVALAAGTRIEVLITPFQADLWRSLTAAGAVSQFIGVAINFTSQLEVID